MKRKFYRMLSVTVCLLLCAVFTIVLLAYTWPMDNKVYDFSLTWDGEAVPDGWTYDQKGWFVFTREGETVRELEPDGYGGFTGLDAPGQTFYFARLLTEDLDAPTLRLGAADRGVAVFLDGELLYTDDFAAGSRIGAMALPMLDTARQEPVVVTLPRDYKGKMLTIAQSTGFYGGEPQSDWLRACPCEAVLYCGYAYESSLISESFRLALPAVTLFLMGIFLLGFFVWQVFHGRADIGLLCAAMAAFLWMTARLTTASFAYSFFGPLPFDVVLLCRDLSRTLMLAFLANRCTGKRRAILGTFAGLQGTLTIIFAFLQLAGRYPFSILSRPEAFGLLSLIAAMVLGFLEWRRERSFFYKLFCPLTAVVTAGYAICVCMIPALRRAVERQPLDSMAGYFLRPLTVLMMSSAIIAGVTVAVHRELERRIEARLLAQSQDLAQAGYESMRIHHEQVMILRHDMVKHLTLLRRMTGERYVADYLDELIGENEKIRPVVQSGNEMLDIILNGKLTAAADAGVKIECARMQAPKELPLSSVEMCSLFMNVMDNAVAAALTSAAEQPYIRLDLHIKGNFFVFSCKNSVSWDHCRERKEEAIPRHGFGMKIIRHITQRYGDLMETERGGDYFKVILAIPLTGPDAGQMSR